MPSPAGSAWTPPLFVVTSLPPVSSDNQDERVRSRRFECGNDGEFMDRSGDGVPDGVAFVGLLGALSCTFLDVNLGPVAARLDAVPCPVAPVLGQGGPRWGYRLWPKDRTAHGLKRLYVIGLPEIHA